MTNRHPNAEKCNELIFKNLGVYICGNKKGASKHIIKWPDRTIRWIFSIRDGQPGYSTFQTGISLKNRILNFLIGRMSYLFKSVPFITFCHNVSICPRGLLGRVLIETGADDWDLFAGSPGPRRNVVVALLKQGYVFEFLKMPLNSSIANNDKMRSSQFTDEYIVYNFISSLKLEKSVIPNVRPLGRAILLSSIVGRPYRNSDQDIVASSLHEIHRATVFKFTIKNYLNRKRLSHRINSICLTKPKDSRLTENIVFVIASHLKNRISVMNVHSTIDTSFALIDFTPWNSSFIKDKLAIFDVEFAEGEVTLGYDLVHFHLQSKIMSEFHPDCKKLKMFLIVKVVPVLVAHYGLSVTEAKQYVDFYLIQNTLRMLELYVNHDCLHRQAIMQIQFWQNINRLWML